MLTRFWLFVLLVPGGWPVGTETVQAASTPEVLRDTLPLKNPKGPHILEAYRYYTGPFGVRPDPEQAEAQWRASSGLAWLLAQNTELSLLHERV